MRHSIAWVLAGALLVFTGCSDEEDDAASPGSSPSSGAGAAGAAGSGGDGSGAQGASGNAGGMGTGGMGTGGQAGPGGGGGQGGGAPFAITSTAFAEGAEIPEVHECNSAGGAADNVSPPFSWTAGPSGTQSYALIMRDLDFMNGFLHWVIWDIPASSLGLPEGIEQVFEPSDPAGAKQAPFNGQLVGYFGPCSPNSTNTYEFTVYAIPTATIAGLDENSSKQEAADAITAAATASAALSGES